MNIFMRRCRVWKAVVGGCLLDGNENVPQNNTAVVVLFVNSFFSHSCEKEAKPELSRLFSDISEEFDFTILFYRRLMYTPTTWTECQICVFFSLIITHWK